MQFSVQVVKFSFRSIELTCHVFFQRDHATSGILGENKPCNSVSEYTAVTLYTSLVGSLARALR